VVVLLTILFAFLSFCGFGNNFGLEVNSWVLLWDWMAVLVYFLDYFLLAWIGGGS
jgi:hypothetical protein